MRKMYTYTTEYDNDYYSNLYDPSFFGCDEYRATVGTATVMVESKAGVDWSTWVAYDCSSDRAHSLFNTGLDEDKLFKEFSAKRLRPDTWSLLELLRAEQCYRYGYLDQLFRLTDLLIWKGADEAVIQAKKLRSAGEALRFFGFDGADTNQNHISTLRRAVNAAVEYVGAHFGSQIYGKDLLSLVKVEVPVRLDFTKRGVRIDDPKSVLEFYHETLSYVLELTAANYQVETLYNYQHCLDIVIERGKKNFYDHGGGIGTLALLAHRRGVQSVTVGELSGPTMDFARNRIERECEEINIVQIDGANIHVPKGVDVIACTEVVEHVFEPEYMIRQLTNALPEDGLFVVSESYDYVERFCTHLPIHRGKGGARFVEYMRTLGFARVTPQEMLHCQVYERT